MSLVLVGLLLVLGSPVLGSALRKRRAPGLAGASQYLTPGFGHHEEAAHALLEMIINVADETEGAGLVSDQGEGSRCTWRDRFDLDIIALQLPLMLLLAAVDQVDR
jgi:hypothetical protein